MASPVRRAVVALLTVPLLAATITSAQAAPPGTPVTLHPRAGVDLEQLAVATGGTALHATGVVAHPTGRLTRRTAGQVAQILPDPTIRTAEAATDTYRTHQYGLDVAGFPAAWAALDGRDLPAVTVAVVDTGGDRHQPDLTGRLLPSITVAGTDGTDDLGHGTAVAGLIAANTGNDEGIAGACPTCQVLPVRVFDADDSGTTTASKVAEGIRLAVRADVDIINLSLASDGGPEPASIASAIRDAHQAGIVVVAAAGNAGDTTVNYPAGTDGVIGVASHTDDLDRARSSTHGDWVPLAAAGSGPSTRPGGVYGFGSGTSFASPLVAAAAGLLLATGTPPDQVAAALQQAAAPAGWVGHGILQVDQLPLGVPIPQPQQVPYDGHRHIPTDGTAVDVAIGIAQAAVGDHAASRVVLATTSRPADALAGTALTGHGPLLLVDPAQPTDRLIAEIDRVLPAPDGCHDPDVVIVGGPDAVPGQLEADLIDAGRCVDRIAGATRTQTAAATASWLHTRPGTPTDRVLLVRGYPTAPDDPSSGWADAATAGGLAGITGQPILLAGTDPADDDALRWLADHPEVTGVTVIGGTAAVPTAYLDALMAQGLTVRRVAGPGRAETAAAVADLWPADTRGQTGTGHLVVDGWAADGWAAALAAAHPAAVGHAPLLYRAGDQTPDATRDRLRDATWTWQLG